jgi:hypothetical protein
MRKQPSRFEGDMLQPSMREEEEENVLAEYILNANKYSIERDNYKICLGHAAQPLSIKVPHE